MSEREKISDRIIEIVRLLVEGLEDEKISYFQGYPTAELAYKGENILVSLIDDNNSDVKCVFNQNLNQGKKYFYVNKSILLNPNYSNAFIVLPLCKQIDEELNTETAFRTNLERVSKLIAAKLYAGALVFIVAALESALSDLFFRYSHVWFQFKAIPTGPIKLGSEQEPEDNNLEKEWLRIEAWEYIYKVCKKFGFYEEYMHRLLGNKLQELGVFGILKKTLKDKRNLNRFINFQSFPKKGIDAAFNSFFGINLKEIGNSRKILNDVIDKRHLVIHADLKDDEVKLETVEQAKNALEQLIAFLNVKLINLGHHFYSFYTL